MILIKVLIILRWIKLFEISSFVLLHNRMKNLKEKLWRSKFLTLLGGESAIWWIRISINRVTSLKKHIHKHVFEGIRVCDFRSRVTQDSRVWDNNDNNFTRILKILIEVSTLLYTSLTDWFYNLGGKCLRRGTDWLLI